MIPKETSLVINTFVLTAITGDQHRKKVIFCISNDQFNPDNFLQENIAKRHPFSAGRRNCLGHKFAIMFIKIILSRLVRNFKITTKSKNEDLKFKYGMTLKLTESHRVSIHKRNI